VAAYQLSRLVAPGSVPPAVSRSIPLAELSRAAHDEPTRQMLRTRLRVLADGKVRAAVVLSPPPRLEPIDLGDLREGGPAFQLEATLVKRDAPSSDAALASSYVSLLFLDHLLGNLQRRHALIDRERGVLVATEGHDLFSAGGVEGGIGDPILRLARSLVFPRAAVSRLRALDRQKLQAALSETGADSAAAMRMMVTPRQLEDVLERKKALLALVDGRIAARGDAKALALP
jgi:hypothetical protein